MSQKLDEPLEEFESFYLNNLAYIPILYYLNN